jgi:hypothetical protein
MRRALAFLPLLLAPVTDAVAADVPLRARLTACATGPEAADRRAAFTASMPRRADADLLELRFTLQRRVPRRWLRVAAPAFDRTERARPRAPGFVFTKQVDGLYTPGRFRAVVRFTWRDGQGRAVARATRATASCAQPDRRPDLRVADAVLAALDGGVATWAVRVANDGRGPLAEPAQLQLVVGDRPPVGTVLPRIEAATEAEVRLAAPACAPGELLRVVADAAGDVRESDERDNALVLPCPA